MLEFNYNQFMNDIYIDKYVLFFGNSFDLTDKKNQQLLKLPWNCIITTKTDGEVISKILNNKNRLARIYNDKEMLVGFNFSITNIPIVQLFENVEYQEHITIFQKSKIQNNAVDIAKNILDRLHNSGNLLIAGIDSNDIISKDSVINIISSFMSNRGNMYCFDWKYDLSLKDEIVQDSPEKIFITDQSITNILPEIEDNFDIDLGEEYSDSKKHIYIDNKLIALDNNFNNELIGLILNYEVISTNVPKQLIKNYFYSFLKESAIEPQWYGYKESFNIKRLYEDELYRCVSYALEHPGKTNKVIMLSGQSGTGKSIALGYLAYTIFNEKKYPVLYLGREYDIFNINNMFSSRISEQSDTNYERRIIDSLLFLKNLNAKNILFIYDLTVAGESERNKCTQLLNRITKKIGINVVMVFATYNVPEDELSNYITIEASVDINSENELSILRTILKRKAKLSKDEIETITDAIKKDGNIVTLLYKIFSEVRPALERGVHREALTHIDAIIKKYDKDSFNEDIVWNSITKILLDRDGTNGVERFIKKDINDLLIFISICSLYNLDIPSDLAFRLVRNVNYQLIKNIFQMPFFVYTNKNTNDYSIRIRTKLEAQMLLRAFHVDSKKQIEYIARLIDNIRPAGVYNSYLESHMMLSLLKYIGPNSELPLLYRNDYSQYFPIIINALTKLRKAGFGSPNYTLHEIVYIREYYTKFQNDQEQTKVELEKAIRIGEAEISDMSKNSKGYDTFMVEIVNSRLRLFDLTKQNIDNSDELSIIRDRMLSAIYKNPENSYAYSTLFYAADKEYSQIKNNDYKKLELKSFYYSIIERMRSDYPEIAYQKDVYKSTTTLFNDFDDNVNCDKYFQETINRNSDCGIFLKVRSILNENGIDVYGAKDITDEQKCLCDKLCEDYLNNEEYVHIIYKSENCLQILLRIKWLIFNKCALSTREKQYTYIDDDGWNELLNICDIYIANIFKQKEENDYFVSRMFLYIKSLCCAQLALYDDFFKVLQIIKEQNDYMGVSFENQIIVKHIICDSNGNPKLFTGHFSRNTIPSEEKGFIRIDGIEPLYGGDGIFYQSIGMPNSTNRVPGQVYSDFQLGLGYKGLRVFRGLNNIR